MLVLKNVLREEKRRGEERRGEERRGEERRKKRRGEEKRREEKRREEKRREEERRRENRRGEKRRKNNPKIYMEPQKTQNSQSNLEKEKQIWGHNSGLQVILQSCSHQDNMVLAQK